MNGIVKTTAKFQAIVGIALAGAQMIPLGHHYLRVSILTMITTGNQIYDK